MLCDYKSKVKCESKPEWNKHTKSETLNTICTDEFDKVSELLTDGRALCGCTSALELKETSKRIMFERNRSLNRSPLHQEMFKFYGIAMKRRQAQKALYTDLFYWAVTPTLAFKLIFDSLTCKVWFNWSLTLFSHACLESIMSMTTHLSVLLSSGGGSVKNVFIMRLV